MALQYAVEIGAVSSTDADQISDTSFDALVQIGKDQAALVEDELPTLRFLGVLHTIVTQGRATLIGKDETIPETKPGIDFIGWRDGEYLYVLPEAISQSVARFCRDTGETLPRWDRLRRDLKKEGLSKTDKDRLTATAWIRSRSQRVLQIDIAAARAALKVEDWL